MLRATVKGVLARKFRLALTGLAVLLGVSFVSTTYVLTDTLDQSFRGVFERTVAGVDVVVQAATGSRRRRPRALRRLDARRRARGRRRRVGRRVHPGLRAVRREGRRPGRHRRRAVVRRVVHRRSRPRAVAARRRRRPPKPRADSGRARWRWTWRPRATTGSASATGRRALGGAEGALRRSSALFALGDGGEVGPLSFAAFDLPTAQRVMAGPGLLDAVYVTGDAGRDRGRAPPRRRGARWGRSFEVSTAGAGRGRHRRGHHRVPRPAHRRAARVRRDRARRRRVHHLQHVHDPRRAAHARARAPAGDGREPAPDHRVGRRRGRGRSAASRRSRGSRSACSSPGSSSRWSARSASTRRAATSCSQTRTARRRDRGGHVRHGRAPRCGRRSAPRPSRRWRRSTTCPRCARCRSAAAPSFGGALIAVGVPVLLVGIDASQSADDVLSTLRDRRASARCSCSSA